MDFMRESVMVAQVVSFQWDFNQILSWTPLNALHFPSQENFFLSLLILFQLFLSACIVGII